MAQEKSGGNFTRRRIATMILIEMLDSAGDPAKKVGAAIKYTDELLDQLKRRRRHVVDNDASSREDR